MSATEPPLAPLRVTVKLADWPSSTVAWVPLARAMLTVMSLPSVMVKVCGEPAAPAVPALLTVPALTRNTSGASLIASATAAMLKLCGAVSVVAMVKEPPPPSVMSVAVSASTVPLLASAPRV